MNRKELIESIEKLTNKEFVELFYELSRDRHIYSGEEEYIRARLVLGNATSDLDNHDRWSPWKLEILCPSRSGESWPDDSSICQAGEHCGHETMSWAKNAVCPICGGEVYGT
jgi:hypothetical protein